MAFKEWVEKKREATRSYLDRIEEAKKKRGERREQDLEARAVRADVEYKHLKKREGFRHRIERTATYKKKVEPSFNLGLGSLGGGSLFGGGAREHREHHKVKHRKKHHKGKKGRSVTINF